MAFHSVPAHEWKQWQILFSWAPNSLQTHDCSHEIKRRLLLGRKVMTNLDSVLKSRDITRLTKAHIVKAILFPVVMWELDHKEGWLPKNWQFQTVVLEKTLESPLDNRRSNQSILKETNPEYSLEGLMLKLKLQYFGHLTQTADLLEKDPDAGKDWQEEKGATEDEIIGWYHRLNGQEFGHTLGDSEGQGSLACCSSCVCRVGHHLTTEQWAT